eukprot:scaffold11749_cov77-Cyclotella_meneghiniana.AAC.1
MVHSRRSTRAACYLLMLLMLVSTKKQLMGLVVVGDGSSRIHSFLCWCWQVLTATQQYAFNLGVGTFE